MSTQITILKVAIPSPLRQTFDYLPPEDRDQRVWPRGLRLKLPFGRRNVIGILVGVAATSEVPRERLKRITAVLDQTPAIPRPIFDLACWAAHYYHHPLGQVFKTILPNLLWRLPVRNAAADGLEQHASQTRWRLTQAGLDARTNVSKRAPRQAALLALLAEHQAGVDRQQLAASGRGWRQALKPLLARQWVEQLEIEQPPQISSASATEPAPDRNAAQTAAIGAITADIGAFRATLLDGVTGSGKTEVYLGAIAAVLERARQALVMVPEIALTPQLVQRFRNRFGDAVAVFHSALSDRERLQTWFAARENRVRIIIGTRSAVFLPLAALGIIVVDEEHDASFKQQEGFRYSARDLAVVRARRAGVPIVLGSATPSLESLRNARAGRYRHLHLSERAGPAKPPRFKLLDIRGRRLIDGLSPMLCTRIRQHLDAGSQALVFINRRGFAPTLICHTCGTAAECRHCDARLTLHQNKRKLVCHHCGAEQAIPARCADCHSRELTALGHGTERIERALNNQFTDASTVRIDRDSTRRKGELERRLQDIARGAGQLLVGTQMLAKGHDFPAVTLVAIVNADAGLYSVDFRAAERLAQIIMQVAGRAGRRAEPGEVVIQTHHPEHPLLTQLIHKGYRGFAAAALAERQTAGLPPCSAQALLRAEAAGREPPLEFLQAAREALMALIAGEVEVLGPAPAPMERRRGRYRAQLLLQAARRIDLQRTLKTWTHALDALPTARRVRWSLDVDPLELF